VETLLTHFCVHGVVFNMFGNASHSPRLVTRTVMKLIREDKDAWQFFNSTVADSIHHMDTVPKMQQSRAKAFGLSGPQNFDGINDSLVAPLPFNPAKTLQQAEQDVSAPSKPYWQSRSTWTEPRGIDVVFDLALLFRPSLQLLVWLAGTAGVWWIWTTDRVVGSRISSTDRKLEIREWILTVALVETTVLTCLMAMTTVWVAFRQVDLDNFNVWTWLWRFSCRVATCGRPLEDPQAAFRC